MAVVRQNVSLDPEEFGIVKGLSANLGLGFSTALGIIIRQWKASDKLLVAGAAFASGLITAQELADEVAVITLTRVEP